MLFSVGACVAPAMYVSECKFKNTGEALTCHFRVILVFLQVVARGCRTLE